MLQISKQHPASRLVFDGLTVRQVQHSDIPEVLRAIEESLPELQRFLHFAHTPQTVETQIARLRERPDFSLGAFQEARFLASLGLMPRVPLNPNGVEIGYWVRTGEAGQGLATLLTRVLIIYCVEGLGMDRVQIAHDPDNVASERVVQKCGFVLEGRQRNSVEAFSYEGLSKNRDSMTYSLLPDEARALPWFAQLAPRIRVYDLIGNDLGQPW